MVDVIIKSDAEGGHTKEIATIKAGIIFRDGKGINLQLSSKVLGKAFEKMFENLEKDKFGNWKQRGNI